MYNKVILSGRLTKDPELNYTKNGKAHSRFIIAVNRRYKKDNEELTDFFHIITWGKLAENVANYLKKGKLVLIDGSLEIRKYIDDNNIDRYMTEIIANEVRFLQK